MEARVRKIKNNAIIPTKGSKDAAGYDLYACCDEVVMIEPHKTEKIGTGLAICPPSGYFRAIVARSELAVKNGLRPANCLGVCDEDYTGEYIVALHNDTGHSQIINPTDRIAQLVFLPYADVDFCEVTELDTTERVDGGFGR